MKEEVILRAYAYAVNEDLESISLVMISNDLNISRRKIYRLFKDKHELMFDVYKIIVDELLLEAHTLNKKNKKTNGYKEVLQAMENMIKTFLNNPKKIKYITKFDALKIDDKEILKKKNDFYRKCDFTQGALYKGVADGSIHNVVNPYRMSCVILEVIIGLVSRYLDTEKEEFIDYMDEKDIYEIIKVYACYLENK
ncbi:MAG: TetR/AcrR family transcriptional regulator [Bacilli bacterium]